MDQTLKRLIEDAAFRETRKGYDRTEVDDFLDRVAGMAGQVEAQLAQALERGRAAEAQLKRLEAEREVLRSSPVEAPSVVEQPDVTEEVARTLVLAQRTADAAVAEAREEAARALAQAQEHAAAAVAEAEAEAVAIRERVEAEAHQYRQEARAGVESEVRALTEAHGALRSDVSVLEESIEARRSQLHDLLGEMQRLLQDAVDGRLEVPPDALAALDLPGPTVDDDEEAEPGAAQDDAHAGAAGDPGAEGSGAESSISYEGWHDVVAIGDPVAPSPDDDGDPSDPAVHVVIDEVDHDAPSGEVNMDAGPPTQEISSADLALDLGEVPPPANAAEDEFFDELRKAINDDEPLGPAHRDLPPLDADDQLFAEGDRGGRGRGSRFGRRR